MLSATSVWASAELDHQYRLETVGYLKAWDNVDGLFAEYVSSTYQTYFSHQSRFVLNDLSKIDEILNQSKLPYFKAIQDTEILGQIARSTHTQSLLRTKIIKEGSKYFFTLDWLHAPQMFLLGTIQFSIEETKDGNPIGSDFISEPLLKNLNLLIAQVPFLGSVTGRDQNSVTVNLGSSSTLKTGDHLIVGTIDEVKKHPLLKRIVDWRISPTGKLLVEQIEDGMSFCKVEEEDPNRPIGRYQKVLQVYAPPANQTDSPEKSNQDSPREEWAPRLGWVSAGLVPGIYSRSFSSIPEAANNSGSGIALSAKISGELWLTRIWFSQLELGSGINTYSQTGVSGSLTNLKIAFGYSYLLNDNPVGTRGWVKVGYKSTSYGLPSSATDLTGPTSFNSFFVGVGGEIPLRGNWGALAFMDLKLATSAKANWLSDSATSTSDFELFLGGYRKINPRLTFRGGLDIQANGADFSAGRTLSEKTVTIGPSLLYYF